MCYSDFVVSHAIQTLSRIHCEKSENLKYMHT